MLKEELQYCIEFIPGDIFASSVSKLESFPFKIVCLSASLTIISYLAGAFVLYFFHPMLSALYLILAATTLMVSMKLRCTHCYYLGRYCNFGLGKLAELIFSKGDPSEFRDPKKVGFTGFLSFGTMLIPVAIGLLLLVTEITLGNLGLLIGYFLIGIAPNFLVRGDFCDKCMQGELGCPSYERMKKPLFPSDK
ncbi:MAG: hypothetical protein ACW98G_12225 [Candidatus Hodarchaeales archaeon]